MNWDASMEGVGADGYNACLDMIAKETLPSKVNSKTCFKLTSTIMRSLLCIILEVNIEPALDSWYCLVRYAD